MEPYPLSVRPGSQTIFDLGNAPRMAGVGEEDLRKSEGTTGMMSDALDRFLGDEDGAITVDWVVLTAGIVGLGMAVMVALSDSIGDVTDKIGSELDNAPTQADSIAKAAGGGN